MTKKMKLLINLYFRLYLYNFNKNKEKTMTKEEIQEFKNKIRETIMPMAENMKDEDIKELIKHIDKENPDLPTGFSNMLYEQILIMKKK